MRRLWVIVLAAAAVLAPAAPAAAADDFAVSLPAEPIKAVPGQVVDISLRIVNRAEDKRTFNIRGVNLESGDQGSVKVSEDDPKSNIWSAALQSPASVDVDAGSYIDLPVKIVVPPQARPDLHLVGVAVEPVKASDPNKIDVRNEVVNHVVVDIPGQANRQVAIKNVKVPKLRFGSDLDGSFDVLNTGDSGLQYRGQVRIDSYFSDDNRAVIRTDDAAGPEVLPTGKTKTASFKWELGGLFAVVKVKPEVNFNDSNDGTKSVQSPGETVVMVPIPSLFGAGVLLVLFLIGATFFLVKRRRRQASDRALA